jgi:glutamate/tyrosine decarboxylase-like PLP-dependent enzyme
MASPPEARNGRRGRASRRTLIVIEFRQHRFARSGMQDSLEALEEAYRLALDYRRGLAGRPCAPERSYDDMRAAFAAPLPASPSPAVEVIGELARTGEPGLMQMAHPRFFGWVLGASHPAGVAADWLASAWGQNTGYHTSSPTAAAVEEVAAGWILEILDLPRAASVGFVTGATMGNFTGLAAARGEVLRRHGWDPDADGLFGAPPIHVHIGEDAHTSVFSALQYLGLGAGRVIRIATDGQGRMSARDLMREVRAREGPKVIIAQAGQINTGAFDPFAELVAIARGSGAWLHVDGAFGLWARASPGLKALTDGVEGADSWATDGHKWLQTPFDTGYAIVRDREAHERAMTTWASYLPARNEGERIPSSLVPELSRRARGLATWAMLKTLGREGVAEMVARHSAVARHMAGRLGAEDGVRVVNEVAINQVIVEFGAESESASARRALTQEVIDRVVETGICFVGGAAWREKWVMRISVIAADTTVEDGDAAVDAMLDAWREARAAHPVGA